MLAHWHIALATGHYIMYSLGPIVALTTRTSLFVIVLIGEPLFGTEPINARRIISVKTTTGNWTMDMHFS